MNIWQNLIEFQRAHPIPLHSDIETILLAGGSVLFFVSKVKSFRKSEQDKKENWIFIGTAIVGLILGFLVDPDR